jgi:hypothetical protein
MAWRSSESSARSRASSTDAPRCSGDKLDPLGQHAVPESPWQIFEPKNIDAHAQPITETRGYLADPFERQSFEDDIHIRSFSEIPPGERSDEPGPPAPKVPDDRSDLARNHRAKHLCAPIIPVPFHPPATDELASQIGWIDSHLG